MIKKLEELRNAVFCDIDGTILKHLNTTSNILTHEHVPEVLDNVKEVFDYWDIKGTCIILTTGRRESARAVTESQLEMAGICYDHLIMGIGSGNRLVINDHSGQVIHGKNWNKALALNVIRDEGLPLDQLKSLDFYGDIKE